MTVTVPNGPSASLSARDRETDHERWLTTPLEPAAEPAAPNEPAVRRRSLRPTSPQQGVPAPVDGLRVVVRREPASLWLVGAHGGAGETTLSRVVTGGVAGDHAWPLTGDAEPARVALVARTSAPGLEAARRAATQWASGQVPGVELLGLILVMDAPGRLPRELRDLARLVAGGVPQVWQVPWLEEVRRGVPEVSWPRPVRQMVSELLSGSAEVQGNEQEGTDG